MDYVQSKSCKTKTFNPLRTAYCCTSAFRVAVHGYVVPFLEGRSTVPSAVNVNWTCNELAEEGGVPAGPGLHQMSKYVP